MFRLSFVGAIWLGALCACSPLSPATVPPPQNAAAALPAATGAGKIKHVIFIIQENRSFDDLFKGYPGADTVDRGKDSSGETIALVPVSLSTAYTLDHSAKAMFVGCDGSGKLPGTRCRMDGFDRELHLGAPPSLKYPMYVYVPHEESKPYFDMAHQWVLADRTFASQLDGSFVAHQYAIAGQAASSVNFPTGAWGCNGGPSDVVRTITKQRSVDGRWERACFSYRTLGDELDDAHLGWRFYTSRYYAPSSDGGAIWSGYQAVAHIYHGPDWHKVVTPQKQFLADVAHGRLAAFTWITPTCANSDHPSCGGGTGPSWVTSLVNAVGTSKFWSSSAVFIVWDDWGGLYDHVAPPYADDDSLGMRVPLLIVSPYAKSGYVSHVQYETASVLRFAEDLFGLAALGAADRRAASPAADCFDFSRGPRKFVSIRAPQGREFFLNRPPDERPPDDR